MNTHKLYKLALAGVLVVTSTQTQAIEFYFEQMSGFDESSFTTSSSGLDNTFSNPTGAGYPADTFSDLNWGFGGEANRSSIHIESYSDAGGFKPTGGISPSSGDPSNGQDDNPTNGLWDEGEWWTTTRITHLNYIINGFGNPLWELEIPSILEIYSDAGHTDQLLSDVNITELQFSETRNLATIDDCSTNFTGLDGPCEDFFTFGTGAFVPVFFNFDGKKYAIDFRVVADPGSVVIPNNGTATVYTPEIDPGEAGLEVQASFREVIQVPEPLALTMLGIGLAGIGFSKRQRKIS